MNCRLIQQTGSDKCTAHTRIQHMLPQVAGVSVQSAWDSCVCTLTTHAKTHTHAGGTALCRLHMMPEPWFRVVASFEHYTAYTTGTMRDDVSTGPFWMCCILTGLHMSASSHLLPTRWI